MNNISIVIAIIHNIVYNNDLDIKQSELVRATEVSTSFYGGVIVKQFPLLWQVLIN